MITADSRENEPELTYGRVPYSRERAEPEYFYRTAYRGNLIEPWKISIYLHAFCGDRTILRYCKSIVSSVARRLGR